MTQYTSTHPQAKNISGQRFGRLLVLDCAGSDKDGRLLWRCRCDCGNETIVGGKKLRSGHTQSCGCLHREQVSKRMRTHGLSHQRVYKIWQGMLERCRNRNNPNFAQYGERGITVCHRWEESFESFMEDMGFPPSTQHTIERVDNNLGYSPDNCIWATRLDQGRNTRRVIKIAIDGRTMTAAEWSEISGIPAGVIRRRLKRGVPSRHAVFAPMRPGVKTERQE